MSIETRIAEESVEAGPEDLLNKKLFDVGIMEIESKTENLNSELELAKAKLLEVRLLGQVDLEKQAQDRIEELEQIFNETKEKLVEIYVGLVQTLKNEKSLLSHLKQRIIEKKLLTKEQRMTILDAIGNRS